MAETGRQRGGAGQDRSLEGLGMDETLVGFNGRLRLTEEERQRLVLPGGLWHADSDTHRLCLVGRLLSSRVPQFETFSTSVQGMINPVKGMDIRQIGGGRFLLRFNHVIDMNRALEGCPWSFEKNVIILSGIGEKENPLRVDLDWFWDMDIDDTGCAWGATLRLRVAIHVNRPLPRAVPIVSTVGDELLVHLTYERLPNFCYFCGKLGHIAKYCELQFEEGFVDPGFDSPYGPWIRAPLPSGGRGQSTRRDPLGVSKIDRNLGPSQPRRAAIFGNFTRQARSASTVQGKMGARRCDGLCATSFESFSLGRLGRQECTRSNGGVAPGASVHGEQELEDLVMDSAEQGDGIPVAPPDGGGHGLEAEKGAETSTEFVASAIPEFELGATVWAMDRTVDRLVGDLVTVPLRFAVRGPAGPSGPAAGV
ncbi:hypothetical protein Salat_1411400 [Sesamum alatum]|uniref:CCHC-type domain-containing protein n=1 Tax=Sesamum alatum TaxID=300844 RepID=A0AAE1YA32_9LAMI|nr:hypothetical protein Salat_1411400 [Sesamum alatum]